MILYVLLALLLEMVNAEQYYEIEDIPIEHFEHSDVQNDAIDVELMPRSPRSFLKAQYDPQDFFFENIPTRREYDFQSETIPGLESRKKRDTTEAKPTSVSAKKLLEGLGKPLELSVIEPDNVTEKEDLNTLAPNERKATDDEENVLINDFLRFKRSDMKEDMVEELNNKKEENSKGTSSKSDTKTSPLESRFKNSAVNFAHTEKLIVSLEAQKEPTRETRGATKEQWAKHRYPVETDEFAYDDNLQAPTVNARAPRVHFVTQEEAGNPPGYKYDREARARSLNKEISRNLDRDLPTEMDFRQPRYTRNYTPRTSDYRDDRYYNNMDQRDARESYPYQRFNDYPDRVRNNYQTANKRQRIIYYATLPDVSRSAPIADSRDRYDRSDYRDRYDDRYYSPELYRFRKVYDKPRYDESFSGKSPYPVKVSADVSVREVKKNPERRIYSDVDRTSYAQSIPYPNDRM